jgi:hypothetical protein
MTGPGNKAASSAGAAASVRVGKQRYLRDEACRDIHHPWDDAFLMADIVTTVEVVNTCSIERM